MEKNMPGSFEEYEERMNQKRIDNQKQVPVGSRYGQAPPIGVRPRTIARLGYCQKRFAELIGGIVRYHDANRLVPEEWTLELKQINDELHDLYEEHPGLEGESVRNKEDKS